MGVEFVEQVDELKLLGGPDRTSVHKIEDRHEVGGLGRGEDELLRVGFGDDEAAEVPGARGDGVEGQEVAAVVGDAAGALGRGRGGQVADDGGLGEANAVENGLVWRALVDAEEGEGGLGGHGDGFNGVGVGYSKVRLRPRFRLRLRGCCLLCSS